jgi:hypothetical protein
MGLQERLADRQLALNLSAFDKRTRQAVGRKSPNADEEVRTMICFLEE